MSRTTGSSTKLGNCLQFGMSDRRTWAYAGSLCARRRISCTLPDVRCCRQLHTKALVAVCAEMFFVVFSRESYPDGRDALILLADECEQVEADVDVFGCGASSLLTVIGIDLLAVDDRRGSV